MGTPDWACCAEVIPIDALKHFDRVIHSAGVLGTSETLEAPCGAVEANVTRTLRVLRLCHEAKVPFTYITLGNNWLNPYSITKNCAAEFVRMYRVVHGLKTQVATCYNVFGPYQKWKPVRKIVPEFMTRILRGEPIELFGGGKQHVDMVYAPDMARAILNNPDAEEAHYGSGVARTVHGVALDCIKVMGENYPTRLENIGDKPGETGPAAIAPYPIPNQTDYFEALQTTAEWYRQALKSS